MLKFAKAWRLDSPGEIAPGVADGFLDLIRRLSFQSEKAYDVFEHFKKYFAKAADKEYGSSTNTRFAEFDLQDRYMNIAVSNSPRFIEAFYDACEDLSRQYPDLPVPDVARINKVLHEHGAGYEIVPPDLICRNPQPQVPVPPPPASMRQHAQEAFQQSLAASDKALAEGNPRQAVSELLWLLETVTTAFRGLEFDDGMVKGKYFNPILGDLKRYGGDKFRQVLGWIEVLHGYLSSPTGGGIRHGADLSGDLVIDLDDGRLYCNLIRSYISYLLAEHERLRLR